MRTPSFLPALVLAAACSNIGLDQQIAYPDSDKSFGLSQASQPVASDTTDEAGETTDASNHNTVTVTMTPPPQFCNDLINNNADYYHDQYQANIDNLLFDSDIGDEIQNMHYDISDTAHFLPNDDIDSLALMSSANDAINDICDPTDRIPEHISFNFWQASNGGSPVNIQEITYVFSDCETSIFSYQYQEEKKDILGYTAENDLDFAMVEITSQNGFTYIYLSDRHRISEYDTDDADISSEDDSVDQEMLDGHVSYFSECLYETAVLSGWTGNNLDLVIALED